MVSPQELQNGPPTRPAVATSTSPTLTDNERVPLLTDLAGNLRVAGQTAQGIAEPAISGGFPVSFQSMVLLLSQILRELRVHNLLLAQLKEPGLTVNIPPLAEPDLGDFQ